MKTKEEILKHEKDTYPYNWGRSAEDMANYAPNEVCHKAMQTFSDQENAELKKEITNLRRRLSDCERKRITGERI